MLFPLFSKEYLPHYISGFIKIFSCGNLALANISIIERICVFDEAIRQTAISIKIGETDNLFLGNILVITGTVGDQEGSVVLFRFIISER